MPLTRCKVKGKAGFKWGAGGHCYPGPAGKARALRQARAVEASRAGAVYNAEARRLLANAFCPTGEGGGVDPTCSPGESSPGKKIASTVADVFSIKTSEVIYITDDSGRAYGEHGGGSATVVNPHLATGRPIGVNFKTVKGITEADHLAYHELVHQVYSADSELGREMADKLAKVAGPYGSAVSVYGAFEGKFENLIELGAVYTHSPNQLKEFSPEMYEIAQEWAAKMKGRINNEEGGSRKRLPNPLRIDPTRTATLRRKFTTELRRRFSGLKAAVLKLVEDEDAFGIGADLKAAMVVNAFDQDQPRDDAGRWAGGPGPPVRESLDRIRRKGGFTFNLFSNKYKDIGSNGYSVSPYPERSVIIEGKVKGNDLRVFVTRNHDLLKTAGHALGVWHDQESGKTYLDVVIVTGSRHEAIRFGQEHNQISIFAFRTGTTIPTGGTGKATTNRHAYRPYRLGQADGRGDREDARTSLSANLVANSGQWRFLSDPEKVKAFQGWLKTQVNQRVLKAGEDAIWRAYIEQGFRKGAGRAFDDAKRSERVLAEGRKKLDFYEGTKDQFLRSAFAQPVAVDKVKLLAGRSFDDLENVSADMSTRMSRTLTDGLVQGKGPHEIARDLAGEVDLGRGRAEGIARTEIIRAHAEGQLEALDQLGVEDVGVAVEWSTVGDEKVCPKCAPLEGIVLKLAEARGMIPRHPNCVVGASIVRANGVLALLETQYTGEIVEVVTAKGRRVAVTPNHILLTEYGFIPASFLCKGLKVICQLGPDASPDAPDDHASQSCIADVFAAAAKDPAMLAERVPLAPENLHGDGGSCKLEVHVVWPNRILRDRLQGSAQVPEHKLVAGQGRWVGGVLPAIGSDAQLLEAVVRASDSSMGRFRELLALLLGRLLHAKAHGLATVPAANPSILQSLVDGAAAAPIALRECLAAHPTLKQLDDLLFWQGGAVKARVVFDLLAKGFQAPLDGIRLHSQFLADGAAGHACPVQSEYFLDEVVGLGLSHVRNLPVYDVQTESTLYQVNGVLGSNCRCAWVPANVGEEDEDQTDTAVGIKAAVRESMAEGDDGDKEGWEWGPGRPIAKDRPESILDNTQGPQRWTGADHSPALEEFSRFLANAFCATGPGGGVDPTCSPKSAQSSIAVPEERG